MRNTRLDEAQAGIKIVERIISDFRYADDTTFKAESEEELKSLLMKVKEETLKAGLKLSIQKTKIMASSSIQFSCSVVSDSLRPHGHQASPSMGFSRHEYWSGLPFPSPGNLPDPGIKPRSPIL